MMCWSTILTVAVFAGCIVEFWVGWSMDLGHIHIYP